MLFTYLIEMFLYNELLKNIKAEHSFKIKKEL